MILGLGFIVFAIQTFSFSAPKGHTDAIIVLTGGKGRVEEGIQLFSQDAAHWLIFIGVDPSVSKGDLLHKQLDSNFQQRVILEKASRNTLENAIYSRKIIMERNIRTIRLITSRYHLMRSLLLFKEIIPEGVALYPHPVESNNLPDTWWLESGSLRLLLKEYYKYIMYRIFFIFYNDLNINAIR